MRTARTFIALATAGVLALSGLTGPGAPPASAATAQHDLVFLVDGSGSIDSADWTLQLQGFTTAMKDRVNFPLDGSMSVSVIQWSAGTPRVEVPLTTLDSTTALNSLVATVGALRQIGSGTNSGEGIRAGTNELLSHGRAGADWTLCMSTDGESNGGESLTSATAFAKTSSVDKYTVVAIEDGGFKAASATRAYGPYVFGGGTVTTARTTAEFTSLISGCVAEASTLEALEVTQSVQDLENTVPLVAIKDTVVRAYLSKTGDPQRTSGRLRGFRGGVELAGSPLSPLNSPTSVFVNADYLEDRSALSSTLNFALPPGWASGTVELALELPGGVTCETPGVGTAPCSETVTFGDGMDYHLQYRGFSWTEGGVKKSVTKDELIEQHERAVSLLPVGAGTASFGVIELDLAIYDIEEANGVLYMEDKFSNATDYSNGSGAQRWYGVIPGEHPGGTEGGQAAGRVASSWLYGDGDITFVGRNRNIAAHELGHTYGLHHTVNTAENGWTKIAWIFQDYKKGWCGEKARGSAPEWPFWHTTKNPEGETVVYPTMSDLSEPRGEAWGLDTRFMLEHRALALSDPEWVTPLMSYCSSRASSSQMQWITPSDYLHLLGDDLTPLSGGAPDLASPGAPASLMVRGTIALDTSTVELQPALTIAANPTASDPDGTHEIAVLDANGTALYATTFTPVLQVGDPADGSNATEPSSALLNVVIPADLPGAKTLQVSTGGTVISSSVMSDSTPTASIDTPTTGTSEDLNITWSSADGDGDSLSHTLFYSTDSGATWDLIAADLTRTSASIPRWTLPASNRARLKVIVSDGLRSSEAISEEFSLPNLAPTVTITDPLDGTTVSGSQTFAMDAQAYDAEDGELGGASVTWTSDRNGKLGTGARLLKRADELAEGTHIITVTATDSAGAKTSKSVTVHVNRVDEVPAEPATCSVSYQVHGTSPGAFTAQVTVLNTGPDTIDGWSLAFKLADGESVTHQWSSDITTGPAGITATNLSWNRAIAPGGTVTFGFNGAITGTGMPAVPDEFLLNGGLCP